VPRQKHPTPGRNGRSSGNPYDLLLERILMGDYAPGRSLSEQEIADDLGISRTPVREALLRLRVEGLVRIVPRGGIFIAEATLRRAREVTSLRLVLEECLVHLVVDRRTDAWLQRFAKWLGDCTKNWESLTSRGWMQKDGEFHQLMDEAGGDAVLAEHLGLLRRQAVLFWGQTTDGNASLKPIIRDFEEIYDAIQERDAVRCNAILRRHVLAHLDRIQTYMRPEAHSISSPVRE
jgi:DNA-binding GntR family transcriptional regulator